TNPPGLNIIVDGVTTTAPRFFSWAPGSQHTLNVPSPQGTGGTRNTFASWSQGGTQSQTVTAPAGNTTYTANFTTQHQLTLSVQPTGAGSIDPNPNSADGFYAAGTNVSLGITTVPGYQFTGYSGDVIATSVPQSVTMSAPRSVTARFICLYSLNPLQTIVDGGANTGSFTLTTGLGCSATAISSSDWISITGGGTGTGTRTISYQVAANNTPANRSGSISIIDSAGTVQTFTITQGAQLPASITVNTSPSGLQFTMDGTTYTAPRTFQFDPGSTHTVSAVSPQTTNGIRRTFTNWTNGASQTHQVTAPTTGAVTLTANYTTTYQLLTTVAPAGSGAISLVPASTDGFYTPGTVVSVSATSNVAQFAGFSGSLTGTTNPQQITMDGARAVTATFTPTTCGTAYTFSPQNIAVPANGGTFSVTVNTAAGCFWGAALSAAFIDPWITLQGGNPAATGTASFTFTAAPNTTNFPRTASINVQGLLVQVVQSGVDVVQPFLDVQPNHLFFDYITLMKRYGNSVGCGNNNYCPEDVTTRAVMAELIIRARFGETFSFVTTPFFTDVPSTHPQFKYIQKMKELGITDGCTATTYCPGNPVTRGEMAVFLIRTRLGVLTPQQFTFGTTPLFTDTPASNIFFAYIQKMKELGITAGCTATTYCINDPNTLGQMAVFVIRSFNTP
ncbi:MAG: S-layer homology domain-containing protein, partial [Bryobacterales bacterium]|nr:S-layer homology domain-containing protein [Bryobacterales bacterium]